MIIITSSYSVNIGLSKKHATTCNKQKMQQYRNQVLFVNYILLFTLFTICCTTVDAGNNMDTAKENIFSIHPSQNVKNNSEHHQRTESVENHQYSLTNDERETLSILNANIVYKWPSVQVNGKPKIEYFYLPVRIPAIIQIPKSYVGYPSGGQKVTSTSFLESRFGDDDEENQTVPSLIHNINNANDPDLPWQQSDDKIDKVMPFVTPANVRQFEASFIYPPYENQETSIQQAQFHRPLTQQLPPVNVIQYSPQIIFADDDTTINEEPLTMQHSSAFNLGFEKMPIWDTQFTHKMEHTTIAPIPLRIPLRNKNNNRQPATNHHSVHFTTTTVPTTTTKRKEPSHCVWAIFNCCKRHNTIDRSKCFEQIGCYGSFWDMNPCADDTFAAAEAEIDKFYQY